MRINVKSQKGAVTLIVIVTMLFLTSFLMTLYIRTANKAQTSVETTREIAEKYASQTSNVTYAGDDEVIPIKSVDDLKLIGTGRTQKIDGKVYTFSEDGYYVLKNDLDLQCDEDNQWIPLPLTDDEAFAGTLDGLGHTISNLYIDNNEDYQGLFGELTGTVKNLNINNGFVRGNSYVGAITGLNNGTINNCRSTVYVAGNSNVTGIKEGVFVEYNVEYTDVYMGYEYTNKTGWRLLDYTNNGDGTISNVKLISTGMPAKMSYYGYDLSVDWWVTEEGVINTPNLPTFRNVLGGEYNNVSNPSGYVFYTGIASYKSLQASAGLYYNFGSIKFTNGTSESTAWGSTLNANNKGWFTKIVNGINPSTTYDSTQNTGKNTDGVITRYNGISGVNLFSDDTKNDIANIRLLTLPELNEAAGRTADLDNLDGYTSDTTGLYRLDRISTGTALAGDALSDYIYNDGYYWLASPYPGTNENNDLCSISFSGTLSYSSNNYYGVRPVICLSSDIVFTEVIKDGWIYYEMN